MMGSILLVLITVLISSHGNHINQTMTLKQKHWYPKKYAAILFETTYSASGTTYNITGYKPDLINPDGYPLHIFIQGTHSDPQSAWSLTVQEMAQYIAERGVISASVWYNNGVYPFTCNGFHTKAESMFNLNNPQSALSVLCNNTPTLDIDCSKGIVLHGISQGAQLVSLVAVNIGNDFKDYIKGINPLAGGASNCVNYGLMDLDQSKIRSRVGLNDGSFCNGESDCRASQSALTGYECANQLQCMMEDGSGWYIIQPDETAAGAARHCYMFLNSECQDAFDPNYYPQCPLCDWSMQADFGWLIQRATQ
eukprot:518305_1